MDLSQLQILLAGLGPWGILIGAGLTVGLQWLRNRIGPQPNVPAPQPGPSSTPILDALLQLIRLKLSKPGPVASFGADADDAAVAKLLKILGDDGPGK